MKLIRLLIKASIRQPINKAIPTTKKEFPTTLHPKTQFKICNYLGWSVVGTALVESGFGRETPFSAERGLSSKVFPLAQIPFHHRTERGGKVLGRGGFGRGGRSFKNPLPFQGLPSSQGLFFQDLLLIRNFAQNREKKRCEMNSLLQK